MTLARTRVGQYEAGNLFLFRWLKPKGIALGASRVWPAAVPVNATSFMQASPIRGWTLPIDEYFCRIKLQALAGSFIGFALDVPFSKQDARLDWFSNIPPRSL